MAWRPVLPMDERVKFALEVERGERSVAEICRIYGVSRKTGYKWIVRYRAGGIEGLRERSRRPLRSPRKTEDEWERRVVYERLKHPRWGPRKLRSLLMRGGNGEGVPRGKHDRGAIKASGVCESAAAAWALAPADAGAVDGGRISQSYVGSRLQGVVPHKGWEAV